MPRRPAPLFPRYAEPALLAALSDTRIVLLQGARQVGKSTLAEQVLRAARPGARWLSLDDPDVLAAARSDPVSFVRSEGLLGIDEIQRVPELLLPIKARVDRDGRPGQFLLTGSAHVLSLPRLADTLPGRMEIVELWPLSQGEVGRRRERFLDRLFARDAEWPQVEALDRRGVLERAVAGGFPEPRVRNASRRAAWFDSYLEAFTARDVRDIQQVEHRRRLRTLLGLLAARTTSLLNVDDLARDARLPHSTARRYLDILEAAYLVLRIPAWSTNRTQRLVSAPKCYVADSGLCSHLLGADPDALASPGSDAGPVIETFALLEIRKQMGWSQEQIALHHLRTKDGTEVDAVLETRAGRIAGVEVKLGATVSERDFRGLRWLSARTGSAFARGVVLYSGERALSFGESLWALPFATLWA